MYFFLLILLSPDKKAAAGIARRRPWVWDGLLSLSADGHSAGQRCCAEGQQECPQHGAESVTGLGNIVQSGVRLGLPHRSEGHITSNSHLLTGDILLVANLPALEGLAGRCGKLIAAYGVSIAGDDKVTGHGTGTITCSIADGVLGYRNHNLNPLGVQGKAGDNSGVEVISIGACFLGVPTLEGVALCSGINRLDNLFAFSYRLAFGGSAMAVGIKAYCILGLFLDNRFPLGVQGKAGGNICGFTALPPLELKVTV